jgi:glutamate N-acetyltransferase/amino-acid N-acetyltransferase
MSKFTEIVGGVCAAVGFKASGVCAGIKVDRDDLALLVSECPATVAGVFTTNAVQAAPVKQCKSVLATGSASVVVINSGCANACTGPAGVVAANAMADATAAALGLTSESVFVCSTGTIGKTLPIDKIRAGLPAAVASLSADGGEAAAKAIMTTDTVDKQMAVRFLIDGTTVHVGGMCKGAGMIEPNMATMLAFLTTDAAVAPASLQRCISAAVNKSFNRISVDGDESTNDTVLFFANGKSGVAELDESHSSWPLFVEAVEAVAMNLAQKIVKDGEGATKFITIMVKGAVTASDASKAAKAVANSMLCKTAWFGGDPNWGRVIAAVGYSGAQVDADLVDIAFDGLSAVTAGQMASGVTFESLEAVFAQKAFEICVDLNLGKAMDTVYTCDCSYDYVKINAEYMT